ncbi:MAG: glycosyltransferase family 4 protein [Gemmatimonadaceae bacterium]
MRILVVNWQDRENPLAGGAEVHLHEIFGRLAGRGHDVTLLCGGWRGCEPCAELDGMRVVRAGTRYTFPAFAGAAYRGLASAAPFDAIVEDINKVPLNTPLWRRPGGGRSPVVALVPHLFGATAFAEAPLPLAAAVWLAERPLASVYGRIPFQAISDSTADDLVLRGIPRSSITVIYPGVDTAHLTPIAGTRSRSPRFAYLGRLKRYKGVDIVLRAFARLAHTDAVLDIAGTGDRRPALERLAASLDLGQRVQFLGFIDDDEKRALLRRSWALVFASPREGWGMTNLEAAACGTPVVASDSPGLRESIRHGETGLLVPHGDVAAMSAALARLAASPALVESFGAAGRRFAEGFTWSRAAAGTEAHLMNHVADGGKH